MNPLYALHDQAYSIRQPHHRMNYNGGSDRVHVVQGGVLYFRVPLSGDSDNSVARCDRVVNQPHGAFSSRTERADHEGKQDGFPERKQTQLFGDRQFGGLVACFEYLLDVVRGVLYHHGPAPSLQTSASSWLQ